MKTWMTVTLRGGAVLASAFLILGYSVQMIQDLGGRSTAMETFAAIMAGTAAPASFETSPIQMLGIVLLLLTPVFRLVLSLLHFVALKDYRLAVFPAISLGFIAAGLYFWSFTPH